jgi:DNA-binding IclR family transcriptional regulator
MFHFSFKRCNNNVLWRKYLANRGGCLMAELKDGSAGSRRRGARNGDSRATELRARNPDTSGALARGFAILRAFEETAAYLGNIEISRRTGIPKATVSRLTGTLSRLGYLSFDKDVQKYAVAPGILALSYQVFMAHELHVFARPLMLRLAEETRSTVGLAVQDGLSVVYLEYAKTRSTQTRDVAIGYRVPVARTALGRSCLAVVSAEAREGFLRDIRKSCRRGEWPELERRIMCAIESVWKRGFCISEGEINPSTNAVGVPFIDGRHTYAFNCVAPVFEFSHTRMTDEIGPALIKLAQDLNSGGRSKRDPLAGSAPGPSLV